MKSFDGKWSAFNQNWENQMQWNGNEKVGADVSCAGNTAVNFISLMLDIGNIQ